MSSLGRRVAQRLPRLPMTLDAQRSALPLRTLHDIQAASFRYRYKGLTCIKNPFDLALYTLLLSTEMPRTIVEIGSAGGGSAVWFASQMRALDQDTQVISLDITPPRRAKDRNVRFIQGDVHDLAASALPALLADVARPLLVVEDGPHTYEGCMASLEFFDTYLRSGEYIVVEDGILKDLRVRELANGPNRAIDAFLASHPGRYEIDRSYCDFYGRNVTWATNGFLHKL